MSSPTTIPPGVFYNALCALVNMSERPQFNIKRIVPTCRQIAEVTCKKLDIYDAKMRRHLTNRLVQYGLENIEVYHV
jgi:hypothetical protein